MPNSFEEEAREILEAVAKNGCKGTSKNINQRVIIQGISKLKALTKIDEEKLLKVIQYAHYLWLEDKADTNNLIKWYVHQIALNQDKWLKGKE